MADLRNKTTVAALLNRYVWLIEQFNINETLTFDQISRKWELSGINTLKTPLPLRTFHDYRKGIEELLGLRILCDRKNDNKYFIEDNSNLFGKQLHNKLIEIISINSLAQESVCVKDRIDFEEAEGGMQFMPTIVNALKRM